MLSIKPLMSVVLVLAGVSGRSSVSAQTTFCSSHLSAGSTCVAKSDACPTGTTELPVLSNYIGCNTIDQKCCQANTGTGSLASQDRQTCGIGSLLPTSRILDGQVTGVCDWPFVVSIRSRLFGSSTLDYSGSTHVCQGVLIDPQWVLTSPYCIISAANSTAHAAANMLVVAAEYNISGIDTNPFTGQQQEQIINVESVHLYPSYSLTSVDDLLPLFENGAVQINSNGVALIKLKEPISGSCSGIACLPTAAEAANTCLVNEECVITGWGFNTDTFTGLSDVLLMSQVRLASDEACDFLTTRLSLSGARPQGSLCQAPRNRNTDSCMGDEGGAILCSTGKNWVVRGILPYNICQQNRFNLYVTDVSPYLSWIESTINSTA